MVKAKSRAIMHEAATHLKKGPFPHGQGEVAVHSRHPKGGKVTSQMLHLSPHFKLRLFLSLEGLLFPLSLSSSPQIAKRRSL